MLHLPGKNVTKHSGYVITSSSCLNRSFTRANGKRFLYDDVLLLLRQSTQSTPDNSKLQGKSKKGGVIGSSNQVTENEKIRKWDGERIQVSCTLGIKKTELQLKYTGLLYTVVELN